MKTFLSRTLRCSRRNIFVGTPRLELVNEKDFHAFLVADSTDTEKWVEGAWECDAFALNLLASAKKWFYKKFGKNIAVGTIWKAGTTISRGHAINYIVTRDYKVRFFEPQDDKEVFPEGKTLFVYI